MSDSWSLGFPFPGAQTSQSWVRRVRRVRWGTAVHSPWSVVLLSDMAYSKCRTAGVWAFHMPEPKHPNRGFVGFVGEQRSGVHGPWSGACRKTIIRRQGVSDSTFEMILRFRHCLVSNRKNGSLSITRTQEGSFVQEWPCAKGVRLFESRTPEGLREQADALPGRDTACIGYLLRCLTTMAMRMIRPLTIGW